MEGDMTSLKMVMTLKQMSQSRWITERELSVTKDSAYKTSKKTSNMGEKSMWMENINNKTEVFENIKK